jgi:hypothetical protein
MKLRTPICPESSTFLDNANRESRRERHDRLLDMRARRVPEEVVLKAQRLESLVFAGYDSYFEGCEPPGL